MFIHFSNVYILKKKSNSNYIYVEVNRTYILVIVTMKIGLTFKMISALKVSPTHMKLYTSLYLYRRAQELISIKLAKL